MNDPSNKDSFIECYNKNDEQIGYYLDTEHQTYKPCYNKCKKCIRGGDDENNNCVECNDDQDYIIVNGNCRIKDDSSTNIMVDSSNNNLVTSYIINKILSTEKIDTHYQYLYDVNSGSEALKTQYSRVFINIEKETIDFIKNKFSLSDDEKIFVTIFEKKSNDSNLATVDYIYEYILGNGTKLEINRIEEDIYIDVYVPIEDLGITNFELAKQFAEQGYDIYDINSDFYNDFCTPANIDGNDMTLKDRMKDIYPHNATLCKNNCKYSGINIEEQRVICSCNLNSDKNIEEESEFVEDNGNFETYLVDNINYRIFKCYKLFFNWKNLVKSKAFYIILTIYFILLIFNFVFIFHSLKKLKLFMAREMFSTKGTLVTESQKINDTQKLNINKFANPKKKKDNPFKSSKGIKNKPKSEKNLFISMFNNKKDKESEDYNDSPFERNKKKKIYENDDFVQGTKDDFVNNEKISEKDVQIQLDNINELPYSKAIVVDKRNICLIFYSFIIEKLELISIFCSDTTIKAILFSEYILALLINFFFNALLYSDEVVSNKYHNNGKLDFIVCLVLSIISNIVTSIICYYLKYSRGIEERIKLILEIKNKSYCYMNIKKLLSFLRIKFICFFVAQLLIVGVCLYYIVIFCILYSCSQKSLIVNYCYSLVESIIISFAITTIILITRKIGLSCLKKDLYNTSKFINSKF